VASPAETSTDRVAEGRDVLRTLSAGAAEAEARLRARIPELADDVLGALGDTWARPVIDRKTRSLQVVAMLSALGKTGPLRSHINGALNHGASAEQVIETLRTVAVYAGFPAAIEAWSVMEEVFAARGIERPGKAS
jgi:4-carboxymuconolactone decarboxylase